MEIQINDYYRIVSNDKDKYNVSIESRSDRKPTEDKPDLFTGWGNAQYYSSIEQACIALLNIMTNTSDARSVEELKEHQSRCVDEIVKAIQDKVPKIA